MEPLVRVSRQEFDSLMREKGLDGTAEYMVERAKQNIVQDAPDFSYQTLRDGTAPLIDFLSGDDQVDPDKRKLNSEQIIRLFSNVEDYGKYDENLTLGEREGAGTRATMSAIGRAAPEAAAGSYGFVKGVRLAAPIANLIPPIGPVGIGARGLVYLLGGLGGSIASALVAEEAEKAVIGEQDPVIPSLESNRRMGETLTFGVSMLASPWMLAPKTASKSATGAIEFLDNFRNVASGKFAARADDALKLTAKNAGLSEKAFESAKKAAETAATRGPAFGKNIRQGTDLGFTRFDPRGYLIDPTKGPLTTRILGATEKGIQSSLQMARQKKPRFLALEGAAGVGGAGGAYIAQEFAPYSEGARFVGEVVGAGLVPVVPSVFIDKGPEAAKAVINTVKRWYSSKGQTETMAGTKLQKDGARRLFAALERSQEYGKDGEEKMQALVDALMREAEFVGPKQPGQSLVVADLAESLDLPFSKTLRAISNELENTSKELAVATTKGRENMMAGSKNALMALVAEGSPDSLAVAARIQQQLFEQNIIDNLEGSLDDLYKAAERVLKRDPDAASSAVDLSEKLYEVLQQNISVSKFREGDLWDQVRDFEITDFRSVNGRKLRLPNSLRVFSIDQRDGGLKFRSIGAESQFKAALGKYKDDVELMAKYFADGEQGENPVTVGRLWDLRSYLADEANVQRRAGNRSLANQLNKYSNTVLQDLIGSKQDQNVAYNTARAYTIARNDVFSRSFLQELQDVSKERGLVLDPSELLDRVFRGKGGALGSASSRRINEMLEAESFLLERAGDKYADVLRRSVKDSDDLTTQDIIDLGVRDALSNIVVKRKIKDALGQEREILDIDIKALDKYRKSAGANKIFKVFPNLRTDLDSVESARNLLTQTLNNGTLLAKAPETQAFQAVIEHANKPSKIIADAMNSDDPVKALDHYVDLIKKQPEKFVDPLTGNEHTREQALSGLRTAMLDYAVNQSGGSGTGFSVNRFQDAIFGRPKGMDPTKKFSFADYMRDNGMLSNRHYNLIEENIKQMKGIEQAFLTGNVEEILFKNPSLSKAFTLRIIGATVGQKFQENLNNLFRKFGLGTQGGGLGGGIVAAEMGSKAVVDLLLRGPETARAKALTQIMSDPKLLGPMLNEIKTKKDADNAMKLLETALSGISRQAGRRLPYATQYLLNLIQEEDYQQLEEQQKLVPEGFSASLDRTPALPTRSAAAPRLSPTVVAQAPVVSTPPAQQARPADRSRFAAMFPEDVTSSLIKAQGIESLLG